MEGCKGENKLKGESSSGLVLLTFEQLGWGGPGGVARNPGYTVLRDLPAPARFLLALLQCLPPPGAKGMTPPSPSGFEHGTGEKGEEEGYFREGQLPPGPQMQ